MTSNTSRGNIIQYIQHIREKIILSFIWFSDTHKKFVLEAILWLKTGIFTASFMITPEQKKMLEKQAKIEERSLSFIVRKTLEAGLKCLNEKQAVNHNH